MAAARKLPPGEELLVLRETPAEDGKVPTEQELASHFGVAKSTMHEALVRAQDRRTRIALEERQARLEDEARRESGARETASDTHTAPPRRAGSTVGGFTPMQLPDGRPATAITAETILEAESARRARRPSRPGEPYVVRVNAGPKEGTPEQHAARLVSLLIRAGYILPVSPHIIGITMRTPEGGVTRAYLFCDSPPNVRPAWDTAANSAVMRAQLRAIVSATRYDAGATSKERRTADMVLTEMYEQTAPESLAVQVL